MLYRYIILRAIQQFQNERSVSAVYYVLQGKQSIQSIQDATLFGLENYFGILKKLTKHRFMDEIHILLTENYIKQANEEYQYELTDKGIDYLRQNNLVKQQLHLDGMTYRQMDEVFFERLLLLIQVWTNSVKKNRYYLPIIDNVRVEHWVKLFYQQTKNQVSEYIYALYNELYTICEEQDELYVKVFLLQLSSYNKIGLTMTQVAEMYDQTVEDIYIITVSFIHKMLQMIQSSKEQYPVLSYVTQKLTHHDDTLTKSAYKTNELRLQGLSIEAIAQFRRLKINTIYDHLVEIAMNQSDFPLSLYVTYDQQRTIIKAIKQTNSYTLKSIKSKVDESITYFQIRLVLALWSSLSD